MPATVLGVDHTGITVGSLLFAYVRDPDGVTLELIQLVPPPPGRSGGHS